MLDPFNASQKKPSNTPQREQIPENAHIRTMRDDLNNLQKTGKINDVSTTTAKVGETKVGNLAENYSAPSNNPFNSGNSAQPPTKQTVAPPPGQESNLTEIPLPESKSSSNRVASLVLIAFGILFVVALAGAGTYYFIKTRTLPQNQQQTGSSVEEQAVVIIDPEEKYSANKINYLPIDISTLTTDEIWNIITSVASELANKPAGPVYEFMIVDSNNNPIAFPIFATAAKLELSPSILANLAEDFSFFFFNDTGIKLSIAAKTNNDAAVATDLLKQEATLIRDLSPIFLESEQITPLTEFGNGSYGNVSIRFKNIDSEKNLSLDYTISDGTLVIATSKNAMHAILDKITEEQQIATLDETEEPNEEVTEEMLEEDIEISENMDMESQAAADSDQPLAEFLEKFKNCEPATYTEQGVMGSSYTFSIMGPESGRCEIKTFYPANPDPNWIDKEMVCLYDNTKNFDEAARDLENAFIDNSVLNCSGPLFDLMRGY